MTAYYNEIDPRAAQWLRNLIEAGHIAPGDVDERSIEDVTPGDIAGYTQCHFFAGIGVWSYALRRAGWPDDRPVWTGSCPCQPFSAAGAQAGFDDERHLWPHFQWLIEQRRPAVVFGEQVDAAVRHGWWDLVASDAESMGYAAAAAVIPASAAGAPHMRHRLWFVLSLGATTKRESEHRNDGKNLHEMPTEKTDHTLLQREEIQGRISDRLQGVLRDSSEETAKSNEPRGEGPESRRASDKARRSGARLLEEEAAEISSQRTDQACSPTSRKEGFGVRPGSVRIGDIRAGGEECLRDDRDCASERRAEGMEHPVLGSNRPGEGLRLQQCESGLLRPELRHGDVGGRSADGNITSPEKEVGINDSEHALQAHDKDERNSGGKTCDVYSGVGAPHIRDRLFWVAHSNSGEQQGQPVLRGLECHRENAGWPKGVGEPESHGDICGVADAHRTGSIERERDNSTERYRDSSAAKGVDDRPGTTGPTNGFWADADWLLCRDGKWRPVEPGTFPLVDGAPARVVRLRAYGNAINAEAAKEFIVSYMEATMYTPVNGNYDAQLTRDMGRTPNAVVGWLLMASWCYYIEPNPCSLLSDALYDKASAWLLRHYDKVTHQFKHLLPREALAAGTAHHLAPDQYPLGIIRMAQLARDVLEAS